MTETPTAIEVIEAAYRDALTMAAIIAYNQAKIHPGCESCCEAIGDAIRALIGEQK